MAALLIMPSWSAWTWTNLTTPWNGCQHECILCVYVAGPFKHREWVTVTHCNRQNLLILLNRAKQDKTGLFSQWHPIKVSLRSFYILPQVHCASHLVNAHFNNGESVRQYDTFSPRVHRLCSSYVTIELLTHKTHCLKSFSLWLPLCVPVLKQHSHTHKL